MFLFTFLTLSTIFLPRGNANPNPQVVGFEEVIQEVQDAIRKLVNHRQNFIQTDMRESCTNREMLMMMKVNIVKGPRQNASFFENYAHYGDDCIIHVYDAGVNSLQKWCTENPARHLNFRQNRSDMVFQGNPLVVNTKCTLFGNDDDFDKDAAESLLRAFLLVGGVILILILISWMFRRDVVVIVNNTPTERKMEEASIPLNPKEVDWEKKARDENNEKLLLLTEEEKDI